MSTTTPNTPPPPPLQTDSRSTLIRNISWGLLITCPIIILLPPRKLDKYTLGLLGGMFLGGNQVSKEYTGASMVQRLQGRLEGMGQGLPPKALEVQRRLREEKEMRLRAQNPQSKAVEGKGREEGVIRELEKKEAKEGLVKRVWLGGEGEDWKEKRDEREKKAIEEGKGYGSLIVDQIWEVWNGGKDKVEEIKEIDKRVVEERREAKGSKK